MRTWPKIACLAFAASALLANASEPTDVRLEPTSEWVLDYAQERCSFYRTYGEGEKALTLRIDSFGSPTDYRFMVMGPAVPDFDVPTSELQVRFTPDTEDRETQAINGKAGEQPAVSFSASFRPYEDPEIFARLSRARQMARSAEPRSPDPEFERQVRTVRMQFKNGEAFELNLGAMARPLAAMRDCLDNLQTSWGLDPAVLKSLTRLAVPKVSTVRRVQREYPPSMIRTGTNAYVPVRVMVDADGNTTACVIQVEQVPDDFKDAVCDNLARGYHPALDSEGRPVASIFRTSVVYLIG